MWNTIDGRTKLVEQLLELFVAGTDTSSTFLEWAFLYMCAYPEAQERKVFLSYLLLIFVLLSLHEDFP